ncbi:MAG: hypothetical protein FWH03_08690 [Firmicutes bacterium]|nr:hypothetical protein [Bacillota bacterium]
MNAIYECKIIRIVRVFEITSIANSKGKIAQTSKLEEYDTFISRVENTINQYTNEGWCIINSNYNVPIISLGHGSASDSDNAEFIFVLQRQK